MPEIKVAFQNCTNLFPVGLVDRAPQTEDELQAKIGNLAEEMVRHLGKPGLLGLCEVYDRPLVRALLNEMGLENYEFEFRPSVVPGQTGIAICYDPHLLKPVPNTVLSDLDLSGARRRPRWLAMAFQVQIGSADAFWFVVNHWKSQMGGVEATNADRQTSAYELGKFFMEKARDLTEAMILIGDFNCEPGDPPLMTQSQRQSPSTVKPTMLRSVRERALVLRDRNRLAYFYNMMWPLMCEPDSVVDAMKPGYLSTRPMGTHGEPVSKPGASGWKMFDHVMVSKRLLYGGLLRVEEGSVRIHVPKNGSADHAALSLIMNCEP